MAARDANGEQLTLPTKSRFECVKEFSSECQQNQCKLLVGALIGNQMLQSSCGQQTATLDGRREAVKLASSAKLGEK